MIICKCVWLFELIWVYYMLIECMFAEYMFLCTICCLNTCLVIKCLLKVWKFVVWMHAFWMHMFGGSKSIFWEEFLKLSIEFNLAFKHRYIDIWIVICIYVYVYVCWHGCMIFMYICIKSFLTFWGFNFLTFFDRGE